ncbi:MAG: hypothetical protein IPP49_11825 [Saprospiraceae bacterium]|nr:hypothetical protein [Saprospiraceae bacterium]
MVKDFILLGAKGQANQLFLNKNGKFVKHPVPDFEIDPGNDKVCGALFDYDQDNDLDFMAGIGGNEYLDGLMGFASYFYLNDGKGNFRRELLGPSITGFASCISPLIWIRTMIRIFSLAVGQSREHMAISPEVGF